MGSTATPNPTGVSPVTIEKTYKFFDLATFKEVAEKATVSFTPAGSYEEALARIGNDSGIVTKALNAYLQRAAFNEKRKEIAGKGASRKIVLSVIKPLRNLPPWADMEDRKAQTESLLEMVRQNTAMVESIKAASLKAVDAEDDDEDDDAGE